MNSYYLQCTNCPNETNGDSRLCDDCSEELTHCPCCKLYTERSNLVESPFMDGCTECLSNYVTHLKEKKR